jgi:hypothetical protein
MRIYTAQLRGLSTHFLFRLRARIHLEVRAFSSAEIMRRRRFYLNLVSIFRSNP